jgi:hypothetical protein
MKKLFLIFVLSLFSAIYNLSEGSRLTASVASTDITPPLQMKYTLGGYGERMNKPATAIHDRIFAKAILLKQDKRKYAIITLDILGLPSNVKSDLIKRISGNGWSIENIMLLPSHSHGSLEMAALNSKNNLNIPQLGIFQPELLEFLVNKLQALIVEADHNYQPVSIGTKNKQIVGLNRNRRKDPDVDNELIVTRVDLDNGKPLAVLVNWTAHPTFLGAKDMEVSAEWPGYLQKELQGMIGHGVTAMYYNGAEGDQSTILNENVSDDYQKIEIYGKKIAALANDLFKDIQPVPVKNFEFTFDTLQLPEHKAHPSFMKTGGEEYGMNENSVKIVMNALCPETVGIGTVRIGDLLIVGVPGEMTAILGKNIKHSLHTDQIKYVAIGGLANEWISYILDKNQYLHGEGYESSVSFYGPDLGQILSEAMIRNAEKLSK